MERISFISYKAASQFSLDRIARFFQLQRPLRWKDHILLEGLHLEIVLKYAAPRKQVYLFQFGCLTFVNFNQDEVFTFLKYLENITGALDFNTLMKYQETHTVLLHPGQGCELWEGAGMYAEDPASIQSLVPAILAKSAALSKMESDIDSLLNEAESFILYLRRGYLLTNTHSYAVTYSKILRFEYEIINSIGLLEHWRYEGIGIKASQSARELEKYYELYDRNDVMKSKIQDLRKIIQVYSAFSYKQHEGLLLVFEIFLLVLFPLSHLLHMVM